MRKLLITTFTFLLVVFLLSCEKIEKVIDFAEKMEETPEKVHEFNMKVKDLTDTVIAKSEAWRRILADSSAVKAEIFDMESEKWQGIVRDSSNMWRVRFNAKSREWKQAASDYKNLLLDLRAKADTSLQKLRALETKLPENLQLALEDIEKAVSNSIGAATSSFLCAADAMEGTLARQLESIQNQIGIEIPYLTNEEIHSFTLCSTSPTVINLSEPSENRNSIILTGYNMSPEMTLEVFLVHSNGSEHQVSSVEFLSENEVKVNLESIGDTRLMLSQKLVFFAGGNFLSEVAIIH